MNSLHSLIGSLSDAGTSYGWRIDALLIGSMLWLVSASLSQLAEAGRR